MKREDNFRLPRWHELPSIDLYLEQVLSLIDEWLGEYMLYSDSKHVMTKTMVNNYVKQKFIKAPVNKKYDKMSVASLFVIAVLKSVYAINEIAELIKFALDADNPEASYNKFCGLTEEAVGKAFSNEDVFANVCSSFACQLYVKRIYLKEKNINSVEEK